MITSLEAVQRVHKKRSEMSRLRKEGRLPGIIFGADEENTMVHVSGRDFQRWARGGASGLLNLEVKGLGNVSVLLEGMQRDPISREVIHVDFLRVKKDTVVRTNMLLEYVGTSAGAKAGGIIQTQRTSIEIEALPANMPNLIQVDISNLEIGDVLRVGDISLPSGVTAATPAEDVLVSCVAPQMQQANEAEDEEESGSADSTE